jgi:hypothetical protein
MCPNNAPTPNTTNCAQSWWLFKQAFIEEETMDAQESWGLGVVTVNKSTIGLTMSFLYYSCVFSGMLLLLLLDILAIEFGFSMKAM